jgi:hypothetical protein
MILCRSTYYKSVPWLRPSDSQKADSFTLELYVWTGLKSAVPASPQYSKTVFNVESLSTTLDVEIGKLIQDFVPDEVVTSNITEVLDGKNSVWVQHQVKYDVAGDITTELVVTDFATNGYGYGNEGKNYAPTKTLLTDTEEVDADNNSFVQVPVLLSEVDPTRIEVKAGATVILAADLAATTDSDAIVSVINIKCKDALERDLITVVTDSGDEYCIFLRDESKHDPVEVQFLNRYGHLQTLTFFKERTDDFEVMSEMYERRLGQPSDGRHQFVEFGKNGQSTFKLSTGYLEESVNTLVKEFLLSEFYWISGEPVNLTTTSQTFQTRLNSKVVAYTMEFKYSYKEINMV